MSLLIAIAIAACPPPPEKRHTCVHDGDTIWIAGEKLRFEAIDTPELDATCQREREIAVRARERLIVLLRKPGVTIERTGKIGAFGRELVRVPGVTEKLIAEGLAVPYRTRRDWCTE